MSRPGSSRRSQNTWTPSTVVALALVVLLAAGGLAVAAGTGAGAGAGAGSAGGSFAAQEVDADQVTLRADVNESGDAHWRIEYRVRLDTDERKAAFSDLEQDVKQNESDYIARFRERMNATVTNAEETTGREMAIENIRVSTSRQTITQEYGVLTYEFRWTNFAVVDGDRLLFGDALAGFFLSEGHSLTMTWPESYELQSVQPSPDETGADRVRWSGKVDFASDEPRVVVTKAGVGISGLLVAGVLAALIILLLVGWQREAVASAVGLGGVGRGPSAPAGEADEAAAAAGGAAGGTGGGAGAAGGAEAAEAAGEAAAGEEGGEEAGEESGEEAGGGGPSEPPEELLSNEERVLRLLEEHGGRMKQQDVVQELGWTDARTSQVVSGLRDEGKIEGFRLGRENVLRLPEADEVAPGEGDEGDATSGSDEEPSGEDESESDDESYGYQG
ncbi:MAG: helix-turn-helix transcriptional regulator [Halopenitus sp.]